jgi:hypothetical protein
MHRLAAIAFLACSVGCGGAGTEQPRGHPGPAPDRAPAPEATPTARASPRDLTAAATFADLVAAARRQDDLRDQDSSAGCLLRTAPWRLEADLAAAVRPLPEPPPSLTARLERVAVLTRYGAIGDRGAADGASAPLGLVAFTTTRPSAGAPAAVLVVTARGLWLGRTDRARFDEIDRSRLATLDDGQSLLFVTAHAGVPLRQLAEALAALPSMPGRIALAVALPGETRLPEPTPPTAETAPRCGLTALPDDAPLGELSLEALRSGVAPLVERARLCAGTTEGAGALGGRVVVSMRIDTSGRVIEACVSEDETDDGVLRACLAGAARELLFDAPSGGSVDVALPMRIEPGLAHRQRALCD